MAGTAVAKETTVVEFGLLGPLQAVRSGRPVPLGGPRQRAVLGFLLLHANTVVSLDRLVDAVWDGRPPDGATTTVQTYVFHLRQALEPDRPRGAPGEVLITRDPGYLLHVDPACIDAAVFETRLAAGRAALDAGRPSEAADELRGALELWRGPVLADLAGYGFVQPGELPDQPVLWAAARPDVGALTAPRAASRTLRACVRVHRSTRQRGLACLRRSVWR